MGHKSDSAPRCRPWLRVRVCAGPVKGWRLGSKTICQHGGDPWVGSMPLSSLSLSFRVLFAVSWSSPEEGFWAQSDSWCQWPDSCSLRRNTNEAFSCAVCTPSFPSLGLSQLGSSARRELGKLLVQSVCQLCVKAEKTRPCHMGYKRGLPVAQWSRFS